MITLILLSLAVICLTSVAVAASGFHRRANNFEALAAKLSVVDLKAFQTLTERSEIEFLRTHLAPSRFRALERCRIRATIGYLRAISENARILLAIGTLAKRSDNQRIAEAAQELSDSALQARLLVIALYARLLPAWVFPSLRAGQLNKVVIGYEQLKDQLLYLVSLQNPTLTSRAASLL